MFMSVCDGGVSETTNVSEYRTKLALAKGTKQVFSTWLHATWWRSWSSLSKRCALRKDIWYKSCLHIYTHSYDSAINLHFGKMVMAVLETNADALMRLFGKSMRKVQKSIWRIVL